MSLAELSEKAGFLPKPEAFDENLKPGFRGGRALFIFFLCNAVPFGALLYYLREQRSQRAQLSLLMLPQTADDVAEEVLRVIRTSSLCFLLEGSDGATSSCVLRVDPHPPEATAYIPPTTPLPLVPQLERNEITDLLESPAVSGLGFIHFAVLRSSPIGQAVLHGRRNASLLYMSNVRGAYGTVTGQLSVLTDPESKRRYWKNSWASSFPAAPPPAAKPQAGAAPEELPAWLNPNYLTLRLAVSEVTLQAIVDGPQRWDSRRAQRLDKAAASEGPKWQLLQPGAA